MKTTIRTLWNSLLVVFLGTLLTGGVAAVRGQSALDAFNPHANGQVDVIVVQPDGKLLIGGQFTTLSPNGGAAVTRNRIARLNADGTLDTAFNPNANSYVYSIAVQADGKILAGGYFTSIGGATRKRIARLMHLERLCARQRSKYRAATTDSHHGGRIAPNHLQGLAVQRLDQVKAGCIWSQSWICSPAASSAGPCIKSSMLPFSLPLCAWRSLNGSRPNL